MRLPQIQPDLLIGKKFEVVAAGEDHIHLREVGSGNPVDVELNWFLMLFEYRGIIIPNSLPE